MKICFLLGSGSGASIPAGYPSVATITDAILSGESTPNEETLLSSQSTLEPLALIRWLKAFAERRYVGEDDCKINYEDLFFLGSQICDDLRGEFENPALQPFIAIAESVLASSGSSGNPSQRLEGIATAGIAQIRKAVEGFLAGPPTRFEHLDFLAEAVAEATSGLDIVTLNHDTLAEVYLQSKAISFTDGFSCVPNEVGIREWEGYDGPDHRNAVRLLKVHGGVNWFRFRPQGADPWTEDYVGIPTSELAWRQKDVRGRTHSKCPQPPIFLIGTFNKLSSYTDAIYLETYYRAKLALDRCDALVAAGYGFGDKGINTLVLNWLYGSLERLLVVLDKSPESLRRRARGAVAAKWEDLVAENRLLPFECDLSNRISWRRIAEMLA